MNQNHTKYIVAYYAELSLKGGAGGIWGFGKEDRKRKRMKMTNKYIKKTSWLQSRFFFSLPRTSQI